MHRQTTTGNAPRSISDSLIIWRKPKPFDQLIQYQQIENYGATTETTNQHRSDQQLQERKVSNARPSDAHDAVVIDIAKDSKNDESKGEPEKFDEVGLDDGKSAYLSLLSTLPADRKAKIDKYFSDYKSEELESLCQEHKKTIDELKAQLNKHWKMFWVFYLDALGALAPEFTYVSWGLKTGTPGVQSSFNQFKIEIPYNQAYGLNAGLTAVDFVYNVHTFSVLQTAINATLKYANWSLKKDLQEFKQLIKTDRTTAVKKVATTAFDQYVVLNHNIVGALANVIEIPFLVDNTALGAFVTFLGVENYRHFSNADYYNDWWRSNIPSLFSEICNGRFAQPLEVFLQGSLGAVGIRAMSFYAIGTEIVAKLGCFGMNPLVIPISTATTVAIHTYRTRYRGTFDLYLGHLNKARQLLTEKFSQDADLQIHIQKQLITLDLDRPEMKAEAQKLVNEIISAEVEVILKKLSKLVESKSRAQNGAFHIVKKSPVSIAQPLLTAAIGAYYVGNRFLTPLIASPDSDNFPLQCAASIIGPAVGTLVAYPTWQAERATVVDQLVAEHLAPPKSQKRDHKIRESCASTFFKMFCYTIVLCSALQRLFGNQGSFKIIPGFEGQDDDNPMEAVILILALKCALNTIVYGGGKVMATFTNYYSGCLFGSSKEKADAQSHRVTSDDSTESKQLVAKK